MNFRKQAIATFVATTVVISTAVTGLAAPADSTDVDIAVTSTGVLSISINESEPFDDITYSFDDQTVTGELLVTVDDLRGTAAGWTFNLRATDFTGATAGPGDTIPVSGLGLTYSPTTTLNGNTVTTGIAGSSIASVSTSGQQITSAADGAGNGQYELAYAGSLLIPGDTLIDTYTSTVTVELPSAP